MILIGTFVLKIKNLVQCAGSAGHCPAYRVKKCPRSLDNGQGGNYFLEGGRTPVRNTNYFFIYQLVVSPLSQKVIHDVDKLSTIVVE